MEATWWKWMNWHWVELHSSNNVLGRNRWVLETFLLLRLWGLMQLEQLQQNWWIFLLLNFLYVGMQKFLWHFLKSKKKNYGDFRVYFIYDPCIFVVSQIRREIPMNWNLLSEFELEFWICHENDVIVGGCIGILDSYLDHYFHNVVFRGEFEKKKCWIKANSGGRWHPFRFNYLAHLALNFNRYISKINCWMGVSKLSYKKGSNSAKYRNVPCFFPQEIPRQK